MRWFNRSQSMILELRLGCRENHRHAHSQTHTRRARTRTHTRTHTRVHETTGNKVGDGDDGLRVTHYSRFKEFRGGKSSAWPQATGSGFIVASQSHF